MISKCYLHPSETATGKCSVCNKPVCRKCSNTHQGKIVCRNCVGKKPVSKEEDPYEVERQERLERDREQRRKSR
jgi:hypothetical protein